MFTPKIILKSVYLLIVIVLMGLFIAGCSQGGSYKLIMGDIHAGEDNIKGSYSSFSGNYYKKVRLNKNTKIYLELTAETETGLITAQLIDPEENKIFEIKEGSQKKKLIKESGKYKIKVVGEDHNGSFELRWEERNE